MASCSTKTVHDIFLSMEYGVSSSSSVMAQGWLQQQSRSLGLFINGKMVYPSERPTSSITKAAGEPVCSTVCAAADDVTSAVSAAHSAFTVWSELSCHQRGRLLQRLLSLMERHGQCLSELCEVIQSPCSVSAVGRLVQYYSSWAQLRDALIPGWSAAGVVAVLVSDDCSLYSLLLKVLPALAMGNTVVVKAGTITGPPALLIASLFGEAGLPPGVLNVITGDRTMGLTMAQCPHVCCFTYSGNKKDGEMVSREMAGYSIPVFFSLSLSAICPFIIFESADLDSAVDGVIEAAFKKKKDWQWMLCVQEAVWDNVAEKLKLRMAGLKCLPLLAESERSSVSAAIQLAEQQGATVIQACPPPSSSLYPPTVLWGLAPSCQAVLSPPPGPILPALSFRTAREGVVLGNHSPHGQAAALWTEDLTLALECARSLCVGSVWVNSHSVLDPALCVCGGKESGNCTDGGKEGLFQYLHPSACLPWPLSTPIPVDYAKFGTSAAGPIVPANPNLSKMPLSYLHLVGGRQCKSDSGSSTTIQAPGGDILAYCPDGGRKDVRNAVETAIKVQPSWMKKSGASRAQPLRSLAESLELKKKDLVVSLLMQTGVSPEEAEEEVELCVTCLCSWAARCEVEGGRVQSLPQPGSALSLPEPIGVVGIVLPNQMPLLSMVYLLGAAVSTGNAVVMVPSEKYPLPALEFIQVVLTSDLPGGLVSIITGGRDQLTQALAHHSVIQAIWYWGSHEGCQYLQHTCSSPVRRLWLHQEKPMREDRRVWADVEPAQMDEMWLQATRWKSVWIPMA